MLKLAGVKNIVGVDRAGVINRNDQYENPMWQWYAKNTNPENLTGTLSEVIRLMIHFLSGPGVLKPEHLQTMAQDPIVFAMANPTPEILPEEAAPYVRVMATGRSDYPNQINNLLCFPGIFKGALDCRASDINEEMKLAASYAIANVVSDEELSEQYIIPSVFNKKVVEKVRLAVIEAAYKSGVARRRYRDYSDKK